MKIPNKSKIIILIKISIIEKAINMGWRVEMQKNKIVLRKQLNKISKLENDTEKFLNYLVALK